MRHRRLLIPIPTPIHHRRTHRRILILSTHATVVLIVVSLVVHEAHRQIQGLLLRRETVGHHPDVQDDHLRPISVGEESHPAAVHPLHIRDLAPGHLKDVAIAVLLHPLVEHVMRVGIAMIRGL
jgi:hypothetical protein